ncbi:MAG: polysaccharide lyase family protein [Bacteroidota bacterium]|nr:polysaccharide lyase family protein [Bacteroidota bacterium]
MKKGLTIIIILIIFLSAVVQAQKLKLSDNGSSVTLSNPKISFSFIKNNAALVSIIKDGKELLTGLSSNSKKGNQTAYLMGPGFSMSPSEYKLVRNTPDIIEIQFLHEAANGYFFELHYALMKDESGIYCFLEQYHHAGSPDGGFGQIRWGLRSSEDLFDYHLVRDNIQGPMPRMADFVREIQDWTYMLPDSTIYSKYDYSDYVDGKNVHGMAGQKSGLGIFVIQPSHEYVNGGPTKQQNTVHATPFMIMMFNCDHFLLAERKTDGPVKGEWKKLGGPFFLYVNSGKDINEIWTDAKKKTEIECSRWPYSWMNHPDYPLQRGTLKGKLVINNQSTAGAHLILAKPGIDWQAQALGYIFSGRANADGSFSIPNIRPGSYTLYAYTDNVTEEYVMNDILIQPSKTTNLNTLTWKPVDNGEKIFQIGTADRTTKGFKLSDHKRAYDVFKQVPQNLTFIVGKSAEANDWYYAQTKNGTWKIIFDANKTYSDSCTLTLCLAGAARNPNLKIRINNQPVSTQNFGNDHSIYRSAILSGFYQQRNLKFPASLLKKGENELTLEMALKNNIIGGIMYDAIKLEGKPTK